MFSAQRLSNFAISIFFALPICTNTRWLWIYAHGLSHICSFICPIFSSSVSTCFHNSRQLRLRAVTYLLFRISDPPCLTASKHPYFQPIKTKSHFTFAHLHTRDSTHRHLKICWRLVSFHKQRWNTAPPCTQACTVSRITSSSHLVDCATTPSGLQASETQHIIAFTHLRLPASQRLSLQAFSIYSFGPPSLRKNIHKPPWFQNSSFHTFAAHVSCTFHSFSATRTRIQHLSRCQHRRRCTHFLRILLLGFCAYIPKTSRFSLLKHSSLHQRISRAKRLLWSAFPIALPFYMSHALFV